MERIDIVTELKACLEQKGRNVIPTAVSNNLKGINIILKLVSYNSGNICVADIAEFLNVSTARIATALNTLEKKGYIERKKATQDARKTLISITPNGKEYLASQEKIIIGHLYNMIENLTDDEALNLLDLIKKM